VYVLPPDGVTVAVPLESPQEVALPEVVAVIPVLAFTTLDAVVEQPPEVTVTV
jgi:hypothetical protein